MCLQELVWLDLTLNFKVGSERQGWVGGPLATTAIIGSRARKLERGKDEQRKRSIFGLGHWTKRLASSKWIFQRTSGLDNLYDH